MAEGKTKTNLEKIEKLIVGGQKEIIDRLVKLEDGQKKLEDGQGRLEAKMDRVDKKHDANAQALYDLLQDTRKELGDKIDQHARQPAHT